MLKAIYWEIKMNILRTLRYRFGMITDILVYSGMISLFLASNMGVSFEIIYGYANYQGMLLLGYIACVYALSTITWLSGGISSELQQGTFYKKLNSAYPLQALLIGKLISIIIIQTAVVIVIVLLAAVVWGVSFSINFISVIAILFSTIGMYGIGLMLSGVAIFYKNMGSLLIIVQTGLMMMTGALPLPQELLTYTEFLPLTICNSVIKLSLLGGDYSNDLLRLAVSSAVFLLLGILVLNLFLKKARKKGNLLFF